jgi:hypothetical protein
MFNSNLTQTVLGLAVVGWVIVIAAPQQASAQRLSLADINAKVACISAASDAGDVYFDGCNVHVRDGGGTTDPGAPPHSGKGNLIIGYNEDDETKDRTGAHNLVIGPQHTYSSFGGLVAGMRNTLGAKHASVTGGRFNSATNKGASVTGGDSNLADGVYASVTGGVYNEASGAYGSVGGGYENDATGAYASSVSGGFYNTASGAFGASVSGGSLNNASGYYGASVSGGFFNDASGYNGAAVNGGRNNEAGHSYSTVSGGNGYSTVEDDDLKP